ncbi:hypothetical protein [Yoonia sediminilitoris]|uniref:Uncharacterized protein n=1 Tax=Yoonia sediminilitoris TaxID=1286148 RepID=A0A2T6K194_9RHOB|nr:hypothetical protein [Yoonia sediminilitoris]PUB08409.1 hypothetical protein C8N45_1343 [Yoonia sediminilitoris]RCW89439.1 hypothetical protein DFP92_1342 [Yoonia sediminilitoris]
MLGIITATIISIGPLSFVLPPLKSWPAACVFYPANSLNAALESLVINGRAWIELLKNSAFFYVMLPIKIGLTNAVSPFTWGFVFTPAMEAVYAAALLATVRGLVWRLSP